MLWITIPEQTMWNEDKECFEITNPVTLCLEHSLVSLSKWESKYEKPFIKNEGKDSNIPVNEFIDYVRCMTLTQNVNPTIYEFLTNENVKKISDYINSKRTATWFNENSQGQRVDGRPSPKQTITSELIYYWMCKYGIDWKAEKWHLNRLLTLIRVCSVEENKDNKMSQKDTMANNRALNMARRKKFGSNG